MELLRLVLMFFILMHHFLMKGGGLNAGYYDGEDLNLMAAFSGSFFLVGGVIVLCLSRAFLE